MFYNMNKKIHLYVFTDIEARVYLRHLPYGFVLVPMRAKPHQECLIANVPDLPVDMLNKLGIVTILPPQGRRLEGFSRYNQDMQSNPLLNATVNPVSFPDDIENKQTRNIRLFRPVTSTVCQPIVTVKEYEQRTNEVEFVRVGKRTCPMATPPISSKKPREINAQLRQALQTPITLQPRQMPLQSPQPMDLDLTQTQVCDMEQETPCFSQVSISAEQIVPDTPIEMTPYPTQTYNRIQLKVLAQQPTLSFQPNQPYDLTKALQSAQYPIVLVKSFMPNSKLIRLPMQTGYVFFLFERHYFRPVGNFEVENKSFMYFNNKLDRTKEELVKDEKLYKFYYKNFEFPNDNQIMTNYEESPSRTAVPVNTFQATTENDDVFEDDITKIAVWINGFYQDQQTPFPELTHIGPNYMNAFKLLLLFDVHRKISITSIYMAMSGGYDVSLNLAVFNMAVIVARANWRFVNQPFVSISNRQNDLPGYQTSSADTIQKRADIEKALANIENAFIFGRMGLERNQYMMQINSLTMDFWNKYVWVLSDKYAYVFNVYEELGWRSQSVGKDLEMNVYKRPFPFNDIRGLPVINVYLIYVNNLQEFADYVVKFIRTNNTMPLMQQIANGELWSAEDIAQYNSKKFVVRGIPYERIEYMAPV